ncbi:hypothetical protein VDF90_03850 [Xanthomonas campestris pv. raphani]|uniref:hypothetical protein n=1 Tax=Xanthomonas campestris TaxID=339 RepID=UPI002B22EDFD|nr:hypothetical protein [Xanthomonas campestris]MEA9786395.1 hypothetical protein [Xanthomonas campestris pv. raphani]
MDFVKPYLTAILVKSKGFSSVAGLAKELRAHLNNSIPQISWQSSVYETKYLKCLTQFFSYDTRPAWSTSAGTWLDHVNAYATILSQGHYSLLHFSDKRYKEIALEGIRKKFILSAQFIDAEEINYIFLKDRVIRALWLYGIHQKSTVKADSKTVFGEDLVDSLDAIGDQTYAYSAARSKVVVGAFDRNVGVNPDKSSLWIGPMDDWDHLMSVSSDLLTLIANMKGMESSPIPTLPTPIKAIAGVLNAFDMDVLLPEQVAGHLGAQAEQMSMMIHAEYSCYISKGSNNGCDFTLFVEELSNGLRSFIGSIDVCPKMREGKLIYSENYALSPEPKKATLLNKFARVLSYPDLLRVWYDSGHIFTVGRAYKVNYRDVSYDNFSWVDFSNTDITKEKPLSLIQPTGKKPLVDLANTGKSNSLFCWLVNGWTSAIAPALWPGWVAAKTFILCDDGAGEKADFIICSGTSTGLSIAFVHIKAAGSASGTKISVSAHDVVLNQAIKNIRYIDKDTLENSINPNATNKFVWEDGVAGSIKDMHDYLKSNTLKRQVSIIVVQPHTRKTFYQNTSATLQRLQLDTLLINASNVASSLNASFYIIGNDV